MAFAVNIESNQTITLTASEPVTLILTNFTLPSPSQKTRLFLQSNTNDKPILIANLEKGKAQNYSCFIKLKLSSDKGEQLRAVDGEVHILGYYEREAGQDKHKGEADPSIIVTRQAIGNGTKVTIQLRKSKRDIQPRAIQSKRVKQQKQRNKSQEESKGKKESLLSMLQKAGQEDSDQQDDDQSFSAKEDDESDGDSEPESQQNDRKGKYAKKKVSWAEMLNNGDDNEQDDEDDYSQEQQQSSEDESSEEEEPSARKKVKGDTEEIKKDRSQRRGSQKSTPERESHSKGKQLPPPPPLPHMIQSQSSSFEFETPKQLPSFIDKK